MLYGLRTRQFMFLYLREVCHEATIGKRDLLCQAAFSEVYHIIYIQPKIVIRS